jgi:hypothetical protein
MNNTRTEEEIKKARDKAILKFKEILDNKKEPIFALCDCFNLFNKELKLYDKK